MTVENTERIERQASEWLARRDSGAWCGRQQAELDAWIEASLEHRVAWLRLLDTWESALRLRALGAGIRSEQPPPPGQWNLSSFFARPATQGRRAARKNSVRYRAGALAASLAIGGACALTWLLWPENVYQTAVGGIESVPIPDGSKVILNTDSRIRIAVSATERRIALEQGEAFFQVAPDPARPFVVTAGSRRVVVLGTAFSVRREKQAIEVIVTEGAVRVEDKSDSKILRAGSIARSGQGVFLVQTAGGSEAEEHLAWRSGNVVFRDVTLAEAAAEFNRYNRRKIVIEDPAVAAFTVGGSFATTNIDAFVRLLERAYPLRADFRREAIVLTGR